VKSQTRGKFVVALAAFGLCMLFAAGASAIPADLGSAVCGAQLAGMPDYDWWYGCSPTAVGMVLGKYDRDGYGVMSYDNIAPGGDAELRLTPGVSNDAATRASYPIASSFIASTGYVSDFYVSGYGASGDDLGPIHTFDCLADFMGTSQDAAGNWNGSTTLYFFTNGSPLHYYQIPGYGITTSSGMYGIYEYLSYAGYGGYVVDIYNQLSDNDAYGLGLTFDFDLADFQAEIDAGRPVVVHIIGHSMMAYGYDAAGNIYIDDTWGLGTGTMPWGGSYAGSPMWGVTTVQMLATPEPATLCLIILGGSAIGLYRTRRRRR